MLIKRFKTWKEKYLEISWKAATPQSVLKVVKDKIKLHFLSSPKLQCFQQVPSSLATKVKAIKIMLTKQM